MPAGLQFNLLKSSPRTPAGRHFGARPGLRGRLDAECPGHVQGSSGARLRPWGSVGGIISVTRSSAGAEINQSRKTEPLKHTFTFVQVPTIWLALRELCQSSTLSRFRFHFFAEYIDTASYAHFEVCVVTGSIEFNTRITYYFTLHLTFFEQIRRYFANSTFCIPCLLGLLLNRFTAWARLQRYVQTLVLIVLSSAYKQPLSLCPSGSVTGLILHVSR